MICSVVIPTIRQTEVLKVTLDSLAVQADGDFEAIVVCDGEDFQTRTLSKVYSANYPLQWIFFPENRGLPSARNAGVLAAKGEIVLFLDDDTSAAHDLVCQHRRHHETWSAQNGLVVYGALVYRYSQKARTHTERFLRRDGERSEARIEAYLTRSGFASAEVDHLYRAIGTNCSIRRSTFLDYGGFDPALRRGEDFELGGRLYDVGTEWIFEPRAIGHHVETKELSEHFRRTCEVTGRMNAYRFLKKGERNAQTRGLTAVQHRSPVSRLKLYWYWCRPDTVRGIANIAHKITDATGSRLSYQVWRRAELAAGYWQGVKSEGLTLKDLRRLVGKALPVLAFPRICLSRDQRSKKDALSTRKFLKIIQTLRMLKYRSVAPGQDTTGGTVGREVVLTFDDYANFYFEVFPYVERFGLKSLVFLVADRLGGWSSWDEQTGFAAHELLSGEAIREMSRHGIQFGSYGLTHAWLPGLADADLHREVVVSKARLEDLLGSEVTCFAYPYGGVDARVRAAVARSGYKFGFTTREGLNLWDDLLCLKRMRVTEFDTVMGVGVRLATGGSTPQALKPLGRILRPYARFLPGFCIKPSNDTDAEFEVTD
jgi:GT2 family glycosyltransferase/peptidoglycan/xylan/chitin deacetylase (PgdA/CDA1 family)